MRETMAAGPGDVKRVKEALRGHVLAWLQPGFTSAYRWESQQVADIVDGLVDSGYVARRLRETAVVGETC